MKDMLQALRWAFRYKYSLVFSILFSALVAASWGANISAVYPFVEVIFQGKTLHHWADDQIRATQQQLAALPAPEVQAVPAPEAKPAEADASTEVEQWKTADQRAKLQSRLENYEKARVWIDRYAPHDPFRTLVAILAFLIAGTIVKSFFRVTSGLLVARASGRMTEDLRNAYFRTLLSDRPLGGQQVGDAAARVGGDIGAIGAAVQILFGRSVQEPLKMGACLLGAAMVNWRLLIFSLLSCPLASLLLIALARSIRHASLRAFDQRCLLMGRMLQTFQGLTVVKAYNMESHERRRFWEHGLKVYREQLKITWYEGLIRSNNELLGIAVMCLSALAGGYLVLEQQTHLLGLRLAVTPMDFGQIMLFYAFLIGCTDPLRKMGDVYGTLQGGIAAAERIMPFISNPLVDPDRHKLRVSDARAALTFDNVHFHYVPSQPVLQGISFRIEFGETVAIIGANGSGKSTLINLLLRFLDPTQGRILLGDHDLLDIRRKTLRRHLALVSQKAVLFNDTVYNNIAYGTRRAQREDVVRAAQQAHAHEFITKNLAGGYDTNCGDGGQRLSGGQQQRITLARAILRQPDILILDEASSQIDPKSEQLIHQSLRQFAKNRTTLLITHRASSLELAHRILLLDAGRVVDFGTHAELMERCPGYRSWRQQTPLKLTA